MGRAPERYGIKPSQKGGPIRAGDLLSEAEEQGGSRAIETTKTNRSKKNRKSKNKHQGKETKSETLVLFKRVKSLPGIRVESIPHKTRGKHRIVKPLKKFMALSSS